MKNIQVIFSGFIVGSLSFFADSASAAVIFSPTSAVINSGGPGTGLIDDTLNQNGLLSGFVNDVTDFDTYIATDPLHSFIVLNNEWFSNESAASAVVTYDLGSARGIDRLALWNEESSGIGSLNLLASDNGIAFTPFASGLTPPDHPVADYPVTVFSFAPLNTRFVRFELSECPQPIPGIFNACSIGEVAFRSASLPSAIPEPNLALALVGLGLFGARALVFRLSPRRSGGTGDRALGVLTGGVNVERPDDLSGS